MIPPNERNPFTPGHGAIPPEYVGREAEQTELLTRLAALKQGISPSDNVIICAPRGNGKTTLLNWFTDRIRARESRHFHVIETTPDKIRTIKYLADAIALPGWLARLQEVTGLKASYTYHGLQIEGDTRSDGDEHAAVTALTKELTRRCRDKPTLLIIDEAHNLEPEVGRTLLNTCQDTAKNAPFQLILAGTPGLHHHLSSVKATFWERGHKIYPDLLAPADTFKALVKPLEQYDITFSEPTLQDIIDDSQGYPYFIQLWGRSLFNTLQQQQQEHIGEAIKNQAQLDLEKQRQPFYGSRYDKLDQDGLLPAAARIAERYETGQPLDRNGVENALGTIKLLPGQTPGTMRNELLSEGYIWQGNPLNQDEYHPGIPSLMTYVKDRMGTGLPEEDA